MPHVVACTNVPRHGVECGDVSLASQLPRTFPFATRFISLPVPCGRGQTPSMVRRANFGWIPVNTLRTSLQTSINPTCAEWQVMQPRHVLVECVGIGQIVHSTKSSIPITVSIQIKQMFSRETADRLRCSRTARAPFLCRTRLRRVPPPAPTATSLQREDLRSSLRSAQRRRRATELCPHRLASRNSTLYLSVTWDKKRRAYRRRTQYERSHTSTDFVVLRRRRSRLGATLIFPVALVTPTSSSHRLPEVRVFGTRGCRHEPVFPCGYFF